MGTGKDQAGKAGRVVSLEKEKYKRLVLKAFDDLTHKERREYADRKAEVERKAKRQL
jgi:hypothetical protein